MKNSNRKVAIHSIQNCIKLSVLIFIFQLLFLKNTNAQPNSIFGGTLIDISEVPYQVSLNYPTSGLFCGGTILNEEWVLTAAHCVDGNNEDGIKIQAGVSSSNNFNVGQIYEVDQIILHPDNNSTYYLQSDIALLHLKSPICFNNNVQPIKVATFENTPDSDLAPGTIAYISGWGEYNDFYETSNLLRGLSIPIISDEEAMNRINDNLNTCPKSQWLADQNIGFFNGSGSVGDGDSGGPATITKSDGTKVLIGVSSWGGCPYIYYPSMYMDVRAFSSFIVDNVIPSSQCSCPNRDLEIKENTIFNKDMDMTGNIIVHSGVELLIESKIGMREGTYIHVERNARLVVDNGGIVTKGCSASDWGGIQVLGNSQKVQPERNSSLNDPEQAGIVWIDNATIEWARCGVTTGGGYNPEQWGGLVHANRATFRNNRKDVEFMSYKFAPNKSKFSNTTFSEIDNAFGNTEGVTIWATDGIEFDNCSFTNKDLEGIRTYDSGVKVMNGSSFTDNETGISSYATYPMSSKIIVGSGAGLENIFTNNKYHINASLTSGLFSTYTNGKFSLEVINNNFEGGEYGVIVDGSSSFKIGGNFFKNIPIASRVENSGFNNVFNNNLMGCNRFRNVSDIGILAIGANKRMQFLGNDFILDSKGVDFLLSNSPWNGNNGAISAVQGALVQPSANCFTNPNLQTDILTLGGTDNFKYYFSGTIPIAICDAEPVNSGNYIKQGVNVLGGIDCAKYGGLPLGLEHPTFEDLNIRNTKLEKIYPTITYDDSSQDQYNQLLDEKEAILIYLIKQSLEEKDYAKVEDYLSTEKSKAANWAIFGLRLEREDYTSATELLESLLLEKEEDFQFKEIQMINIKRLQNPSVFKLTAEEETYLDKVAQSSTPVRGYARGILGILKDNRYYPEKFEKGEQRSNPEFNFKNIENPSLKISPNPANNQVLVSWPNWDKSTEAYLQVFDIFGRAKINDKIFSNETQRNFDISQFPNGIYLLKINSKGKSLFQTNLIIQR
jgi:secreted trypsin-like serine protease